MHYLYYRNEDWWLKALNCHENNMTMQNNLNDPKICILSFLEPRI